MVVESETYKVDKSNVTQQQVDIKDRKWKVLRVLKNICILTVIGIILIFILVSSTCTLKIDNEQKEIEVVESTEVELDTTRDTTKGIEITYDNQFVPMSQDILKTDKNEVESNIENNVITDIKEPNTEGNVSDTQTVINTTFKIKIVEIYNFTVMSIINSGFDTIKLYTEGKSNSRGEDIDIKKTLDNLRINIERKYGYDSYMNSLKEIKDTQLITDWNELSKEIDTLYKYIQDNELKNEGSTVIDTTRLHKLSEQFISTASGLGIYSK